MKTIIIYAHPYNKSFNHAILQHEVQRLVGADISYQVIDLYDENFNATFTERGLQLFSTGGSDDPQVREYQAMIKSADNLEFIFPIWWNDLPGMVKGFLDKVFTLHFAYEDASKGIKGLLTNITSANVITTSKSPTWYLKYFTGNAIGNAFIKGTLKQVGITNVNWKNFGNIKKSTETQREKFLKHL
ncbi:NAD(P)H-dependent oxidoreductase [Lactiplantibacillus plantarum]|uniref:NAD(P)H-dependent oxidoreductase n=1 Tax=Lactiplantibacillus plantarum TaxID=1590 RepID=UPI00093558BA|nr:NAD(P)H-dependent oxidoreductase [Lactiplantibacillus plantarum]MDV9115141.1 NAD(P)H-dependent oxidoreductase [Lactiplantibacillus plantarum]